MNRNLGFYLLGLIIGATAMSLFQFKLDVHKTVYVPFQVHTFGQQEETNADETHQAV